MLKTMSDDAKPAGRAAPQGCLTGRTALVTGGGRGLGFEIAKAYADAGAHVYLTGREAAQLEHACDRLSRGGMTAHPIAFDIADETAQDAAMARIVAEAGRLDILVNNVGARLREPLARIGGAELRALLDTNIVSAFALARRAAPVMVRGGYGRIINISSVVSERGRAGDAAYIIAKSAMNAMTRVLAAELGSEGITCNAILPGTFRTETNAAMLSNSQMDEWLQAKTLLGRAAEPPEIAGAALFLASPAASYVTGALLPVDGGFLAAY